MIRRWWHRLFGHPQITYAGDTGKSNGKSEMYFCTGCSGWVGIEQTGHRHIRIVEHGHKL